jgi:murein DD-endopeptidase MepM/ murein hydrolase activator NlpD
MPPFPAHPHLVSGLNQLGVCGNSGSTTQPHLHFHLQDGPIPFQASGLPVTFVDYVSNGQPVAEGTPVQGELLKHGKD